MLDPKEPFYNAGSRAYGVTQVASLLGIVFLVATLVVVIWAWNTRKPVWVVVFAGLWAVGPPIWFWWEYFFLFRKYGRPDTLELFKYGQQVAAAIWAGVALSLAAYASSDRFKETTPQAPAVRSPQPSERLAGESPPPP